MRNDPVPEQQQDRESSEMLVAAVGALEEGVDGVSREMAGNRLMQNEMQRAIEDSEAAKDALAAADKLLEVAAAEHTGVFTCADVCL